MVVVEDVAMVEVDRMDNIEFGMDDIYDVEGNMDHPIEDVVLMSKIYINKFEEVTRLCY